LHVLDEIVIPKDGNTDTLCQVFYQKSEVYRKLSRMHGRKLRVLVTGDASSNARHTSANASDQQLIRAFFNRKANEFDAQLWFASGNPPVRTRVNAVNDFLMSAVGIRRLFVNPKCNWLMRDFSKVQFIDGAATVLDQYKDKTLTHISDALGYLVMAVGGGQENEGSVMTNMLV